MSKMTWEEFWQEYDRLNPGAKRPVDEAVATLRDLMVDLRRGAVMHRYHVADTLEVVIAKLGGMSETPSKSTLKRQAVLKGDDKVNQSDER